MSGLLSPRMLGCRAEDAAADAHREVLADNLLQLLGAVLAREPGVGVDGAARVDGVALLVLAGPRHVPHLREYAVLRCEYAV